MIDDYGDGPSAFRAVLRQARKPHRCCECRTVIPAAAAYEYASGVWDDGPGSFKTCVKCVRLRAAHAAAVLVGEGDPVVVFGALLCKIGSWCRDDAEYLAAFRSAYRKEKSRCRESECRESECGGESFARSASGLPERS